MYGFVNQAARDLVLENHGSDVWERVKSAANLESDHFISDETYDDKITYDMVGGIAKELGITVPEALITFGDWWVSFVDAKGYGTLLSANGVSFEDFLSNLDQFHSRLAMAYPKFSPPDFEFARLDDGRFELFYISEREGLAPMVEGILYGLAKRYGETITVEMESRSDGARFLITPQNDE